MPTLLVETDPWERWKVLFESTPVSQTPDELEQLFVARTMNDGERSGQCPLSPPNLIRTAEGSRGTDSRNKSVVTDDTVQR